MAKGHGVVVVIFIHTLQSRPAATLLSRRRKPIHALPTLDGIVGSLDFISSLSVLVVVVLSRIYERKWFSFGWSLKRERELRGQCREVSVTFQWMGAWMRDSVWARGWVPGRLRGRWRSTGVGWRGRETFLFYPPPSLWSLLLARCFPIREEEKKTELRVGEKGLVH